MPTTELLPSFPSSPSPSPSSLFSSLFAEALAASFRALAAASAAGPTPSLSSTHPPNVSNSLVMHPSASPASMLSRASSAPVCSAVPGKPCATRTTLFTARSKRLEESKSQS